MTSTSLTGSQNEIGIPTRGIGLEHVQSTLRAFGVSSPFLETRMPAMVIGKIQLQQISVTGLINLPTHLLSTEVIRLNIINTAGITRLNIRQYLFNF